MHRKKKHGQEYTKHMKKKLVTNENISKKNRVVMEVLINVKGPNPSSGPTLATIHASPPTGGRKLDRV